MFYHEFCAKLYNLGFSYEGDNTYKYTDSFVYIAVTSGIKVTKNSGISVSVIERNTVEDRYGCYMAARGHDLSCDDALMVIKQALSDEVVEVV